MIKSIFKFLFATLIIVISILFYNNKIDNKLWGNYTPIITNSEDDLSRSVELLKGLGFTDILYKDGVSLPINSYTEVSEKLYSNILTDLDENDYRYDPFVKNLKTLFYTADDSSKPILYIRKQDTSILSIYNIHKLFKSNGISYKLGNSSYLRLLLNFLSFTTIIILLGFGCKKRAIISLFFGIIAYFIVTPLTYNHFVSITLLYLVVIMIVESISFSNRYIKRNNVGILRILIVIGMFSSPTYLPLFLDYNDKIYTPVLIDEVGFEYGALTRAYNTDSVNLSGYFTHYAYQQSFLYGDKYLFPTYGNSVTIDEFKREDYYLSRYEKVVFNYDEEYLKDFLSYCNSTVLGRFYLDYGRPFTLEINSLLTLYNNEKEFMQMGLLSLIILIAALLFKKNGAKKLKY